MTFYQRILVSAIPGLMFGIVPAQGIDLRFSWQLFSLWTAAAVFTRGLLRSWWLRLFFVLAFITVLRYGPIATSYLTLLTIAVFIAATEGIRDVEPSAVYNAMIVAAILLLAWGCLQLSGIVRYLPPLSPDTNVGPFNINTASAFFAMCLPAFFSREPIALYLPGPSRKHRIKLYEFNVPIKLYKWAIPIWCLQPVPVFGIVLSRSTTGFMAAIAACFVYAALSRSVSRKVFVTVMAGLILAGAVFFAVIDPPGKKDMVRLDIWKHTAWSFKSEMFGRGLGSFEQLFPMMILSDTELAKKTGGGWVIHAHNEYLQVGFDIGIPALVLILTFLAVTYGRAWRCRESLTEHEIIALSGLAATAVAAANFHTFHVAPTALLGCVWIGRNLKAVNSNG